MRRQRKHRHHPDIWRERHMAEKLADRRWFRIPIRSEKGAAMDDFWRSINAACLKPATATLTIEAMQAVYDRIMGDTIAL